MKKTKIIITEKEPTTLLQDFATFLHYIGDHKVKLTKVSQNISRSYVKEIDEALTMDRYAVTANSDQSEYTNIHLLFHLALDQRLIRKNGTKSQIFLELNDDRVDAFKSLTPTEQYVTLLDSFWTKVDWDELQRGRFSGPYSVPELIDCCREITAGQKVELESFILRDSYISFYYYFAYFGFWEFELGEDLKEYSRRYNPIVAKTITITPLFKQLLDPLEETLDEWKGSNTMMNSLASLFMDEPSANEEEEEESIPPLKDLLIPFFPEGELKQILSDVVENDKVIGNYLLKAQLHPDCWRTLQLSSSHTLLDLHYLIQATFDFDDDHLYSFFMDGRRFSKNAYHSQMDWEGPYASEVKIGELDLYEGQQFLYLFDFGDEWHFLIKVMKIEAGEEVEEEEAKLVESKGESPDQYG